jgi:uncharacterized membrane protein YhhN
MTAEATPQPSGAVRLVFYLGAAVALSHLANEWVRLAQPWGPAWKCAGILLLGLYALLTGARLAALGFLFSAAGDVLLELDGLFVGGMAAFGLAHVCYMAAFVGIIRRDGVNKHAWPLAALVLVISAGLGMWLAPGMAQLAGPALAYQAIISAMVVSAILSKAPLAARVGAVIFMLSDTLIAVGIFRDIDVLPGSVWITYAAAQIMLAWGFVKARGA